MGAIDAGIEVEPDTRDGKYNLSWQLADRTSPTNSPSPFTPNPGHHHASAASEQAEARRSAAHHLMLASGPSSRSRHWRHKSIRPAEAIPPPRIDIPAVCVRIFRQLKKSHEN